MENVKSEWVLFLDADIYSHQILSAETTATKEVIKRYGNKITELNIGHFLIGEAVFIGLANAIDKMKRIMAEARKVEVSKSDSPYNKRAL